MSVACSCREHHHAMGHHLAPRFVFLHIYLLSLFFSLLFPAVSAAKIYVHKEKDSTLYFTNDRRNLDKVREHRAADRKAARRGEPEQAPREAQEAVQEPVKQDITSEPPGLRDLLYRVAQAFTDGAPDDILALFKSFSEPLPEQERDNLLFFEMFFATFGTARSFIIVRDEAGFQQIGRVYTGFQKQWQDVECRWRHVTLRADLAEHSCPLLLQLGICQDGEDYGIKDMGVGLLAPPEEMLAKLEGFQREYARQLGEASRARAMEEREKALEERKKNLASTPQPQPSTTPLPPVTASPPEREAQGAGDALPDFMPSFPDATEIQPWALQNAQLLLQFFSGTFVMLFFGVSLLLQLFMYLCLYLIARKLRVSCAWMSWAPVLQIHPMVLAAGLPGWWTPALLGSAVLMLVPVVGMIVPLGVLVATLYIWMRISERLGLNKWLGLLIIVPLAQLVYPAWLAFKQDALRRDISLRPVLLKTFLAYILLMALAWVGVEFLLMPVVRPVLEAQQFTGLPQRLESATESGGPETRRQVTPESADSDVPAPAAPAPEDETAAYVDLGAAEYEQLLSQGHAPLDADAAGAHTLVGPVLLELGTFWDDPQTPHVWILVKLPLLPNLESTGRSGMVRIARVMNDKGQDVYDRESGFEGEQFQKLTFGRMRFPALHLQSIRDVHLVAGVKNKDIHSIEGVLQLRLPLGVQSVAFSTAETGQTKEVNGQSVTLKQVDGMKIAAEINGDPDSHLDSRAYDAAGNVVDQQYSSWSTSMGRKDLSITFNGPVERVEFYFVRDFLDKEWPFVLQAGENPA